MTSADVRVAAPAPLLDRPGAHHLHAWDVRRRSHMVPKLFTAAPIRIHGMTLEACTLTR